MISRTNILGWLGTIAIVINALACADAPTSLVHPTTPSADAVKFWESLASTRWNERATQLLGSTRPPPMGRRRRRRAEC